MTELRKRAALGPERLLARVAGEFPALSWRSYDYIDRGWDHEVLILDGRLVFRFPNDDFYARRLRSEIEILSRLGPLTSVAIPQYSHVARNGGFAGYPLVGGERLTPELFTRLPGRDRAEIARQLAGLLTRLHTLSEADIDLGLVAASDLAESHEEVASQARARLPPVLSERDMELVEEIVADSDSLFAEPVALVPIHGDIYSDHLLWDAGEGRLGVIDFSDMNLGDAAFDFAELHEYGDEFVKDVYRLYGARKDDGFLERSWRYLRWVAVYMMTDHFIYGKTSFAVARATFDRVRLGID
ncbi:MAG TPA: aminoglycoside phosphotransferase family protein [Solirubrobacteraceae bacterium]|jgi:aminoglycoside phosphotransferase (APT) family kinase protein|nr:aminoglycoside phosphotransferase family protein [Solirubrobacteraceae bacterium]